MLILTMSPNSCAARLYAQHNIHKITLSSIQVQRLNYCEIVVYCKHLQYSVVPIMLQCTYKRGGESSHDLAPDSPLSVAGLATRGGVTSPRAAW